MARPRTIISIVSLLASAPGITQAQIKTPVGYLFPELRVVSDYRYDGFSNSDRQASVQAGLYLWRADKLYAGAELARVRFNDGSHIDVELDLYGGRNFDFGKTRITIEEMATLFPDQRGPAPTYSFAQTNLKTRREFGRLTLGGRLSWTPQGSYHAGNVWKLAGEASYRATSWAEIGARLGGLDSQRGQDRTFWDAGVTFKHAKVALDLRYTDTNLSRPKCFYTDRCQPGVVGKLTFSLPLSSTKQGDSQ